MGKIFGYIISIILIGLGVGGLFYLTHPKDYSDTALEDISPETRFDWSTLEEGMYVKLEANNQIAYYSYKKDDNGKDLTRIYLVYDYNQKTNSSSHVIGVMVDAKDFDKWDSLESENLSPNEYLKEITVTNHIHKIPPTVIKSLKNSLEFDREEDADKIVAMLVPYYIGSGVMSEDIAIYKTVAWVAIAVGCILLIVSIFGSIISRD